MPPGAFSSADIVIVGAGVMGASLAFHLGRRRAGRVLVIDKARVGQGGSGRSSALIRMHYTYPPEVQLAVKSLEIFRHWREIVGRPGDFHQIGFIQIVAASDVDRLRANVRMQQALGVNTRVISIEELREIEPDWAVDAGIAAAYEPESGYGDGYATAYDFLAAAREQGVEYLSQTCVTSLEVTGDRVRGVRIGADLIEAPTVVAATGPWTRPLLAKAGVDVPIETEFHKVVFLQNTAGMKPGGCACIDHALEIYFRSEGPHLTLVGTFYGPRGVDPDRYEQTPSQEALADAASGIERRVPALADAAVVRGITGVYDMTPDARPLLGPVPRIDGLHLMAGFSGMGFKIAPAVGLVMAEMLLDGRTSTVDLHPFRPSRFVEGMPIAAEYEYQEGGFGRRW